MSQKINFEFYHNKNKIIDTIGGFIPQITQNLTIKGIQNRIHN